MQRGGVPGEPPPPERETNASTTSLAWMAATSFLCAAEWMFAIGFALLLEIVDNLSRQRTRS